jgi:dienelactone hydrolase
VIHDALGISRDLRNEADWLASEGYLAVAPYLYYSGRRITCMIAFIRESVLTAAGIDHEIKGVARRGPRLSQRPRPR